jgi:hypothetical protein
MSVKPYLSSNDESFLFEDPTEFVYYNSTNSENDHLSSISRFYTGSLKSTSSTDITKEKDITECFCTIL